MSQTSDIACYAIRRVNPFLGVLQVIETPDGRATTTNGLTWDIQVIARLPAEWGSLNQSSQDKAYYRYGLWSPDTGLVNRPLAVQSEDSELTRLSNQLIQAIEANLDKLPFTLLDSRELWLLDAANQQPLALLASMRPGANAPKPEPRYWSGSIGQAGIASQHRFPFVEQLESQVRKRAGFNLVKRWYTRGNDGTGYADEQQSILPVNMFPPLLLSEIWQDAELQNTAIAYLNWIAPALLTLQHLSDDLRNRLEANLTQQAVSVEHHWRLYPTVLDQQNLNSCRVQAQLQLANDN